MSKALSIDKAVDGNLKPVKDSDGTMTALEISTDKVRVKDFTVAGNIVGALKSATDLNLNAEGDIILDAAGTDISFAVGGKSYLTWSATGLLQMMAAADIDDLLQFTVANNGISKIKTFDSSSGGLADLSIVAEGDITLDSENGVFIMKKDGTEFSVSNSAYAGMILGYTTVGIDAADDSYTLTTTMTCLDDAMKVKFVAPPSGVVEIFAQIYFDAARRVPVLGLSDANETTGYSPIDFPNSNDVTNEHIQAVAPSLSGDSVLRPHWVVTGLTAGTAYEWWIAAKISAGTGGVLRWGGNVTNEYPPFIMRATALPAAVTDYAVYG